MSLPKTWFGLAVAFSLTGPANAQDLRYTDQKCLESPDCTRLMNAKPDYSDFEAKVLKVIDADTLKLEIYLWPGLVETVNVRSRGVDAPESLPGRYHCEREHELGEDAKASIERKFKPGTPVIVSAISYDKYGGRVVAQIDRWASDRFTSVAEELLQKEGEWGVPYNGEGPKHNWCAVPPKAVNDNG